VTAAATGAGALEDTGPDVKNPMPTAQAAAVSSAQERIGVTIEMPLLVEMLLVVVNGIGVMTDGVIETMVSVATTIGEEAEDATVETAMVLAVDATEESVSAALRHL
jgi:hypothetical protein